MGRIKNIVEDVNILFHLKENFKAIGESIKTIDKQLLDLADDDNKISEKLLSVKKDMEFLDQKITSIEKNCNDKLHHLEEKIQLMVSSMIKDFTIQILSDRQFQIKKQLEGGKEGGL